MKEKIQSELERLSAEIQTETSRLAIMANEYEERRKTQQIKLSGLVGQLSTLMAIAKQSN